MPELFLSAPSLSVLTPVPVPAPVQVPTPVPVPVLRSFSRLRPCSSSCSRPVPTTVPVVGSTPDPVPIPVYSFPSLGCGRLLVIMRMHGGLANGAFECPQVSLPVCRDDVACGIKVPGVKQNRIDVVDVLLPFPPPDAGTRWSVSPTCTPPV